MDYNIEANSKGENDMHHKDENIKDYFDSLNLTNFLGQLIRSLFRQKLIVIYNLAEANLNKQVIIHLLIDNSILDYLLQAL